jgi:regulator of protease activity HflC (stomatin/prohibitin superfamily)
MKNDAEFAENVKITARGNPIKKILGWSLLVVILVGGVVASGGLFENVPAGYICVIQSPISGELSVYTEPGLKLQKYGKVTYYPRSGIFEFRQPVDPTDKAQEKSYKVEDDKSLKIAFNDSGTAWISGSVRYDYPLAQEMIVTLHKIFSSHEAVLKGLIETTVERSVYMTGPLMSSIDSAMSRKADLPAFISSQMMNGLFAVQTRDVAMEDEITHEVRRVKIAEPVKDTASPDGYARQEESILSKYGMVLSNLSIDNITYDQRVQQRITTVFDSQSEIQIATQNAKRAEQDKRTAILKGEADAATAEWKAKTIAAEEIAAASKEAEIQKIAAQRDKDVAELGAQRDKNVALLAAQKAREVAEQEKITASLYRDAQLLRAEADATYKKKIIEADGALAQKLDAYVSVNKAFAEAISSYKGSWVPQIQTGASTGTNTAMDMLNILAIKAAKDLALEVNVQK